MKLHRVATDQFDHYMTPADAPPLSALIADMAFIRDLMSDGLTLRHLSVLTDCAERAERAFLTLNSNS